MNWETIWNELDWENEEHQQNRLIQRLRQRAEQYASVGGQSQDFDIDSQTVLVFWLDSQRYAIDITRIQGVEKITEFTRVPGVPLFYKGVVNVRGKIVTVLDLRLFLHENEQKIESDADEIIVLQADQMQMALLVDHVESIVEIPKTSISSANTMSYTSGITSDKIAILNIANLLQDQRILSNQVED